MPCSITTPTVEGIDNLWKFRGVIDGFNESLSQIASGVVKTDDESMSAIRFRTTPKGDLPHYSYFYEAGSIGGVDQ